VVSIGLSAGAVARVRFAVSCLWEVAASVRVLRAPGSHGVHLPWVNKVRGALVEAGLIGAGPGDVGGGLLWQLIPAEPGYLPDFLTPPAGGLTPDLDAELAVLRATAARVVRAEVDLCPGPRPGAVEELYTDPEAGLRRLADEITRYWRIALAADWPRIRVLLDAEVFQRSRELAEDGTASLLNDLHQRVRWEGDTLSITQRYCRAPDIADGDGLVLIPSVFVWPSVLSVNAAPALQLAYPARGIAKLWECPARASDALSAVVGRGRAQLLVEMRSPVSTTELARRTGMSPAGVSQHLAALRGAGLVATHRQGKAVLNTRTTVAEALLTVAT
jgi:DNA-binding transcriptional ArsR family regulator